jgi:Uma2 family endonuclease
MSSAAKPWTLERFLAWEERQELRYEFDGFSPVAMTDGTAVHDAIQVNLVLALGNRLRGKPCHVHGSNLKIEVAGRIRYPDAFVTCTPLLLDSTVATEPVVIFEVLGRSMAQTDSMAKNREYAATSSVRRYVMLEQAAIQGMMFARSGEDGEWIGHILGPDAVLHMPEIGSDVPIAEFYAGIDLSAVDPTEADDA